jgi:DNA gyrase subunit B
VEGGYLYIAQPPLYRLTRGNEKTYLKDDGEFKKYLLQRGIEKKRLRLGRQRTLEGAPLAQALEKVIAFQEYLNRFEKRGLARKVVRLLLDHGVVSKESLRQEEGLQAVLRPERHENLTARLEFDENACWALLVTTRHKLWKSALTRAFGAATFNPWCAWTSRTWPTSRPRPPPGE